MTSGNPLERKMWALSMEKVMGIQSISLKCTKAEPFGDLINTWKSQKSKILKLKNFAVVTLFYLQIFTFQMLWTTKTQGSTFLVTDKILRSQVLPRCRQSHIWVYTFFWRNQGAEPRMMKRHKRERQTKSSGWSKNRVYNMCRARTFKFGRS